MTAVGGALSVIFRKVVKKLKFSYRASRRFSYIDVWDLDMAKCHRTSHWGRCISIILICCHCAPSDGSKLNHHLGCRDDCRGTRLSLE